MSNPAKPPSAGMTLLVWAISILGGAIMITVGWGKLQGGPPWPEAFEGWGYPVWFRILIGLAQLAGGVAVFIPRIASYGAGLLVVVMTGALVTELLQEPQFGAAMPAILGGMFVLVFFLRRRVAIGPLRS